MMLAERLRDETLAHQARLEVLPCFQALVSRTLLPESQRALHQALALLNRDLMWALAAASHPALVAARAEDPPLHPLLEPGLVHESPREIHQRPVLIRAIALGERMRSALHREPLSLLGYHYALRLALFPLPDTSPWLELTRLLEGVSLEAAQEDGLVRAVSEAFSQVEGLLDTLHPPSALPPVYWLNRDAGSQPITTDVDELRAAIRAAEASWEASSYYTWRYGEHGRPFSWSDSAWLVMLGDESDDAVWKHISWLGRLLAARGMPRLLLERHLRVLHQELVRAKPALQERYGVLSRMAERMAGERRQFLDDETMSMLSVDFDERVGPEWSQRLRRTGELLAAAVADECGGLTQAVPSLAAWMCEPSRFPSSWIRAVEDTLVRARGLCRVGGS
ncbi:hypothetical protein JQX13_02820 [Archangium violaceum]|uniref:hypothetical protein n=1 Tax=Archangium violaceum TaxID=83451 RepID=UPI00193C4B88|nr:hypothetical protein [Archangium violaceum]QRK09110.1 hypothetical protein JQX13_02820 [Archangium violaceum]